MRSYRTSKAVDSAIQARSFACYALVLHTDQDHPHVHLVVKAVSEEGKRLNIRKATLREWGGLFAQHLRAHGVAANATERAVRGQTQSRLKDVSTALRCGAIPDICGSSTLRAESC